MALFSFPDGCVCSTLTTCVDDDDVAMAGFVRVSGSVCRCCIVVVGVVIWFVEADDLTLTSERTILSGETIVDDCDDENVELPLFVDVSPSIGVVVGVVMEVIPWLLLFNNVESSCSLLPLSNTGGDPASIR